MRCINIMNTTYKNKMDKQFYKFTAKTLQGKEISMESFRGKTVMVVNTASNCGFTPQYEGLQKLYEKYSDRGLVILGFPCNQFGNQEPGDEKSIAEGCLINYGVTFPMFSKIDVNGDNAHPIFVYLKKSLRAFPTAKIKWNFTKFIIDGNGNPLRRYAPTTTPAKIDLFLEKLLA